MSSIKVLLQLLIRKLSLGFRALAYRHLYEALSAKCSKQGASICMEFIKGCGEWGAPKKKKSSVETGGFTLLWNQSLHGGKKNLACCCGIYEMVSIFCVCARACLPERQNNDSYCTQYTVNSSTPCKEEAAQLCNRGLFSYSVKKKMDEIMEKAHFLLNLDSGFANKIAFILHNMCSHRLRPCNLARA